MRAKTSLFVLLTVTTACSAVRAPESGVRPSVAALRPSDRYHPDMSQMYGLGNHCDGTYVPITQILSWVGRPAAGRVAAVTRVVAIGPPRWNTPSGKRPTQSEADAMVDGRDDIPRIFTPVTLEIDRVYAGSASAKRIVGFAESGTIGRDEVSSCSFGSPSRLQLRESDLIVTVGESYLAILGNEMLTGRATGPLAQPVINDLYLIRGEKVVGLNGTLEPLP